MHVAKICAEEGRMEPLSFCLPSRHFGETTTRVAKLNDEEGRLASLHRHEVLDTDPERPFDNVTALIRTALDVPICAVSLIDQERQWFKSINGLNAKETERSVSFCTHTIRTYDPMIISDACADWRFKDNPLVTGPPYIRSYAGAPLVSSDGYNLGALCAIGLEPRTFSDLHIGMLQNLAALVVNELELRRTANTDQLTGALTRRGFLTRAEKELDRFRRYQRRSALLVFDIDDFKALNDSLGHPTGDEVLRAIARTCSGALRANDFLGRLGGEEFGVLFAETSKNEAMAGAERLRSLIGALKFPEQPSLQVTASFGVAPATTRTSNSERWLADADTALYGAKRTGRDRCVLSIMNLT